MRSPDYRMFNHVIVAIEGLSDKGYVFCDPTVPYAKAGTLAPMDGDRDLLVIKNDGAEWTHSPKQDGGEFHYDFDLALGSGSELSGCLTEKTTGFQAALHAWHFRRLDAAATRSQLQGLLRQFYSGAEITDFKIPPGKEWKETYQVRINFAIPAPGNARQLMVAFPQVQPLFNGLKETVDAQVPFYQSSEKRSVHFRISVPAGMSPKEVPPSFESDSPGCSAKVGWHFAGRVCEADLIVDKHGGAFPLREAEKYAKEVASLESSLGQPLLFSGKNGGEAGSQAGDMPADFPQLSSGRAQLDLVDKLYPLSGNLMMRRKALKKTIDYFPLDTTARFIATVELANIDRLNHKASEAVEKLQAVLKSFKAESVGFFYSLGEYNLALALADAGRQTEACSLFKRLAQTQAVPPAQRPWCRFFAASILLKDSPKQAAELLLENAWKETTAQASSIGLLAPLLVKSGSESELRAILKNFFGEQSADFETAVKALEQTLQGLKPAEAERLVNLVDECSRDTTAADRVATVLKEMRGTVELSIAYLAIQQELKNYLGSNPDMEFQKIPLPPNLKTRQDFMSAANGEGSVDAALRYLMEAVTRFEPDANFSTGLTTAAGTIIMHMAQGQKSAYDRLLSAILSLCDRLPENDINYGAGEVDRGSVLFHCGDFAGAREKFGAALAGKLSEKWRMYGEFDLAGTLEMLGDYSKSLEHFKACESSSVFPLGVARGVHPALLNLELGNRLEALRILRVVSKQPKPSNSQPVDCVDLLVLAEQGKAEHYWDAAARWWPAWEALEKKVGLKPAGNKPINLMAVDAWGSEFEAAVTAKDRLTYLDHFRMLVHAGRWDPRCALEVCLQADRTVPLVVPEYAADFWNFLVTLLDNFQSDDVNLKRSAENLRVSCYSRLGQNEKVLECTGRFLKENTINDLIAEDMARFQALAALALGRNDALRTAVGPLKELLASEKLLRKRRLEVMALQMLYQKLGSADQERALLERELNHADIREDSATFKSLSQRYQALKKCGEDSSNFSEVVRRWLAANGPSWFDFAEPKSLNDPRLQNLEKTADEWNKEVDAKKRPVAEIIKLNFLVALDQGQPAQFKETAFTKAFQRLISLCRTTADVRKLSASVIDDPSFPEPVRVICAGYALLDAALFEHREEAEYYASLPIGKKLPEAGMPAWDEMLAFARADHSSPAAIENACASLLSKPLSTLDAVILQGYAKDLLRRGEWDRLKKLGDRVSCCQIAASSFTLAAIQMSLLRAINEAKANEPMNRALMEVVLKRYREEPVQISKPVFAAIHDPLQPRFLKDEDLQKLLLYRVQTRQIFGDNFPEWIRLMKSFQGTPEGRALQHELAETAIQKAATDRQREAVINQLLVITNMDDSGERDWAVEQLKPYRDDQSQQETFAQIRLSETRRALRTGQPVDLEKAFENVNTAHLQRSIQSVKMRYYLGTGNLTALKEVVDSLKAEDLIQPGMLPVAIPVLDALEMTDEAGLARDASNRELYRLIINSWTHSDCAQVRLIINLAAATGSMPLPAEWLADLQKSENLEDNLRVRIQQARAKGDWAAAAELSARAAALPSDDNDYYWFEAEALYKVGRKSEAAKPLAVFLGRAMENYYYPQARCLAQLLQQTAGTSRVEK